MKKRLVYLFGFSPWQGFQLQNLIKIIDNQISSEIEINVVLMHDGVIGSSTNGENPPALEKLMNLPINIHVMIPDLIARGIDPSTVKEKFDKLEYEDLVDLIAEKASIISWL